MDKPRSIYVVSVIYVFHFQSHIDDITSFKKVLLFLYILYNISFYFWVITWMKKENNFEIAKFQSQGVT